MPEERREEIINEELVSTIEGWYEVVTKDADGVAHTHRLYKHSIKTRPDHEVSENLFTRQAPPNKITPTKRQRGETATETILFYGDTHYPFQDKRKIALANLATRVLMPDVVTYVGDDLDMAMFSSFETRQEWLNSTQAGIDQFSDQLAQTRADIGKNGQIIVHEGNHNIRFARELRRYNAELLGIKRANAENELGVLTLDFLLRCGEMNVEYISGYPESEYWHNDNLKSYHGTVTQANGLATVKEIQSETVNFVHGHTHHAGITYKTFRDGRDEKTIFGMEVGTFADLEQTPSGKFSTSETGNVLRQTQNWQSGLGRVAIHDEIVVADFIPITDRGVLLDGKWYQS